jgi:hypothetical protein
LPNNRQASISNNRFIGNVERVNFRKLHGLHLEGEKLISLPTKSTYRIY